MDVGDSDVPLFPIPIKAAGERDGLATSGRQCVLPCLAINGRRYLQARKRNRKRKPHLCDFPTILVQLYGVLCSFPTLMVRIYTTMCGFPTPLVQLCTTWYGRLAVVSPRFWWDKYGHTPPIPTAPPEIQEIREIQKGGGKGGWETKSGQGGLLEEMTEVHADRPPFNTHIVWSSLMKVKLVAPSILVSSVSITLPRQHRI